MGVGDAPVLRQVVSENVADKVQALSIAEWDSVVGMGFIVIVIVIILCGRGDFHGRSGGEEGFSVMGGGGRESGVEHVDEDGE